MENTEQECLREEAERERTIPHDPDPEDGAPRMERELWLALKYREATQTDASTGGSRINFVSA